MGSGSSRFVATWDRPAGMDLNRVTEFVKRPSNDAQSSWRDGDAWLAGGTWLFSEPQPGVRRLIDLDGFGWEPLRVTGGGLEIAATCKIAALSGAKLPEEWIAAPLIQQCCRALLASFKIWNMATVGGNICMALPAGAMISLTTALEGVCEIWHADGGKSRIPVHDFVTGDHANVLRPSEVLRAIHLPASALRKRTAFRQMSRSNLGRSAVLLIGTLCPATGRFNLTVSAATTRPLLLEFSAMPSAENLTARLGSIRQDLYFEDMHGSPDYRRHMTHYFAEEIRRELGVGA